jgi:hypothetical protein
MTSTFNASAGLDSQGNVINYRKYYISDFRHKKSPEEPGLR